MNNANTTNANMWRHIQSTLNAINHVAIIIVAVFMSMLCYRLSFKDTALHVFLTTMGFHFLMAEALMSHYPLNAFTKNLTRRSKTKVHSLLQLLGGQMALIGSAYKIATTTEAHFNSWHGQVGLAATFMCTASLIGGLVNYFQPKLAQRLYTISEIKYRHNLYGMLTFTLGMAAIMLGYQSLFFERHIGAAYSFAFTSITMLIYMLTLISPLASLMEKRKYRNRKL